MNKNTNLPLYLTLFRLVVSPLFFPFVLYLFLPRNIFFINSTLAIIFLIIGFTDFLDGYFARRWGVETSLGKMLDHTADKVLVGATLITLVAIHKIWFFWAILLIAREIFVAGMRQVASEHKQVIHVSWLGKAKTALQIVMCAWIIANPNQQLALSASAWNSGELALIIATLLLSWWSARSYYTVFVQK